MLRSEIQKETGLTRKAIEYYREKGLIAPIKDGSGYRVYSEKDLEKLRKICLYRKLGLSVSEIEKLFMEGESILPSLLRNKQYEVEVKERKNRILEMILCGKTKEEVDNECDRLEQEEFLYERLKSIFLGYFGQAIFWYYKPFFEEPIKIGGEEAYKKYIQYLDTLPTLNLSIQEKEYMEKASEFFDKNTLEKVNVDKMKAIENSKEWLEENGEWVLEYEKYKKSEAYLSSKMKQILDKMKKYMLDNKYYEVAIPLIRKFSKSYDEYYKKLLETDINYTCMKSKKNENL